MTRRRVGVLVAMAVMAAACGSEADSSDTDPTEAAATAVEDHSTSSSSTVRTSTASTASSVPTLHEPATTLTPPNDPPAAQSTGPAPPVSLAPPPPSTAAPSPPPATVPRRELPAWTGRAEPISPELADRMTGVSWHDGCPVPIADLRLLHVAHVGFDGHRHEGRLVVHADAVDAVLEAFLRMYEARFPIERVTLVDDAGGSDDAAMAANLTTAFNCRRVTGGSGWSEHAMGRAIDINPVQNPYISSRGTVLPASGRAHVDRSVATIGMIVEGGPAVAAFDTVGWHWGGRWRTIKDYQHFSATGR